MDMELGKIKAEAFRQVLKPRPCNVTGSKDPMLLQYPVPKDWEFKSFRELKSLLLKTSGEADEDDNLLMADLGGESSGSAGPVEVKVEPPTPEAKLQARIDDLKATRTTQLRKFQDLELEAKLIANFRGTAKAIFFVFVCLFVLFCFSTKHIKPFFNG